MRPAKARYEETVASGRRDEKSKLESRSFAMLCFGHDAVYIARIPEGSV